MSRRDVLLVFMRHGIAEDRATFLGEDNERSLTEEGRKKTRTIARQLAKVYLPDIILTSPLVRAVETARIVENVIQKAAGRKPMLVQTRALSPESTWEQWLEFVRKEDDLFIDERKVLEQRRVIMIIGHEPSLSTIFARYLRVNDDRVPFKKAGIGILRKEESDSARLIAFLPPRLLLSL